MGSAPFSNGVRDNFVKRGSRFFIRERPDVEDFGNDGVATQDQGQEVTGIHFAHRFRGFPVQQNIAIFAELFGGLASFD
jgi:hypothetical protein